jgi:SAM-dependent methyltransferase
MKATWQHLRSRPDISDVSQTWHYGLVAKWWAEFNDDFRIHEIRYFQRHIENDGQPALDVGCGTGRLLLPFLRAGLDVDGCDVSSDMIDLCKRRVIREGFSPNISVQAMHQLDAPRRYKTIFVCGAFGLGSTREQDLEALRRFHDHLEPGGKLVLDIEAPYADSRQWGYWTREMRHALPEAARPSGGHRRASDGSRYALAAHVMDVDPLNQRVMLAIHAEQWRGETLQTDEDHLLTVNLYFKNELLLMLERARFASVSIEGDHNGEKPTSDDAYLVFVASK